MGRGETRARSSKARRGFSRGSKARLGSTELGFGRPRRCHPHFPIRRSFVRYGPEHIGRSCPVPQAQWPRRINEWRWQRFSSQWEASSGRTFGLGTLPTPLVDVTRAFWELAPGMRPSPPRSRRRSHAASQCPDRSASSEIQLDVLCGGRRWGRVHLPSKPPSQSAASANFGRPRHISAEVGPEAAHLGERILPTLANASPECSKSTVPFRNDFDRCRMPHRVWGHSGRPEVNSEGPPLLGRTCALAWGVSGV